ncbi:MAG: hypothetical protein ACKVVT_17720 [Dehalococcoidia bacterium]
MEVTSLGTDLMGRRRNGSLVAALLTLLFGIFLAWGWFAVVGGLFVIRTTQEWVTRRSLSAERSGRPRSG